MISSILLYFTQFLFPVILMSYAAIFTCKFTTKICFNSYDLFNLFSEGNLMTMKKPTDVDVGVRWLCTHFPENQALFLQIVEFYRCPSHDPLKQLNIELIFSMVFNCFVISSNPILLIKKLMRKALLASSKVNLIF